MPQEIQPPSQPFIIDSQVTASFSGSAPPWECTFQLEGKALPFNSYLQTWISGEEGQVSDSLGQVLLLPANMVHYVDCRDDDLVLKLKWYTITIRFSSTRAFCQCLFPHLFIYFTYFYCISVIKFTSVTSRSGITLTLPFGWYRPPNWPMWWRVGWRMPKRRPTRKIPLNR